MVLNEWQKIITRTFGASAHKDYGYLAELSDPAAVATALEGTDDYAFITVMNALSACQSREEAAMVVHDTMAQIENQMEDAQMASMGYQTAH